MVRVPRRRGARSISATEAAKNFGAVVDRVREARAACVVERGGIPVAEIVQGGLAAAGRPEVLFKTPLATVSPVTEQYAPASDGQRFFMVVPAQAGTQEALTVVTNWPALVR